MIGYITRHTFLLHLQGCNRLQPPLQGYNPHYNLDRYNPFRYNPPCYNPLKVVTTKYVVTTFVTRVVSSQCTVNEKHAHTEEAVSRRGQPVVLGTVEWIQLELEERGWSNMEQRGGDRAGRAAWERMVDTTPLRRTMGAATMCRMSAARKEFRMDGRRVDVWTDD